MATATAMVTVRMAGMATTASPRTATTAIPPTATALMAMAIRATAMATAAATGKAEFPGFHPSRQALAAADAARRDRASGDGSPGGARAVPYGTASRPNPPYS